jgi:hypothetical protein
VVADAPMVSVFEPISKVPAVVEGFALERVSTPFTVPSALKLTPVALFIGYCSV